jgi:glycosyltransferase involved in cell wall biosynthesis
MSDPIVSVVIPTRNAAGSLRGAILSLQKQTHPPDEIIVVDGGSVDETVAIAKDAGATVEETAANRSAQRNRGAELSRGDYLLFIDADMVLSPPVIEECLQKAPHHVALVIPETFVGVSYWARVRGFERSFYDFTWWMEAARWFRRQDYLELGGFDSSLVGPEDWDLDQRARERGSVDWIQARIFHQEGNVSLRALWRKKGHYAACLREFERRHPDRAALCLRLGPRLRLLAHRPAEFVRHPQLAAGLALLGAGEFLLSRSATLRKGSSTVERPHPLQAK